jgi:hypothetical protein
MDNVRASRTDSGALNNIQCGYGLELLYAAHLHVIEADLHGLLARDQCSPLEQADEEGRIRGSKWPTFRLWHCGIMDKRVGVEGFFHI